MNETRKIVFPLIYARFNWSYAERAVRKYRNFSLCNCDMPSYNKKKKLKKL